ncbi:MAG: HAD-IA family hydrolase [Herpetosiphonaceae bacterium]|nr:HAD-IA family hydrolase [Herpetosiphonaceae bacterium]
MPQYRALSFDVGYTLIGPVAEAKEVVAGFLASRGLHPTAAEVATAYVRAEELYQRHYHQPLNDTWSSDQGIHTFFTEYYGQLLGELGLPDPDGIHAAAIIEHYLEPTNWHLYPGVHPTLIELRRRGFRIGVASDWGTGLWRILQTLGLTQLFDWTVVSGGIGFAKPSAAFYGLVVKRAGVPAHTILHVGDTYRADILGARTVGMDGVLIDWQGRSWPRLDVPVLASLSELLDLVGVPLPVGTS